MSTEDKPAEGPQESGLMTVLRIMVLMLVGPAVFLYLLARVLG